MQTYVSHGMRVKNIYRCALSNGRWETGDTARDIYATSKGEAERLYRVQMRGKVHVLDPVLVTLTEGSKQHD